MTKATAEIRCMLIPLHEGQLLLPNAAVAEVIEGSALHNGRVEVKEGLASAAASLITLGTGGSTGREGPVVHLAGVISSWVANRIKADGITGRDLLGCAVAAAVSASFNAPIAGALFAVEVILGDFAAVSLTPIVIASVVATVISRGILGDTPAFQVPQYELVSGWLDAHANTLEYITPDAGAMLYLRYAQKVNSSELATRLMNEKSGLLVPGDHFGMDGWLRIGFGGETDHVALGLTRVEELLATY